MDTLFDGIFNSFLEEFVDGIIKELHMPDRQLTYSVSIYDIQSRKARNLLRGLDPSVNKQIELALKKIKRVSSSVDYKKCVLFLMTNDKFETSNFGRLLNSRCPKVQSEVGNN